MKVVVTGATGFVGRHTVRKLLDYGYEVTALTTSQVIPEPVSEYISGSNVLALNKLEEVTGDLMKGSVIIHCGWSGVQNTMDSAHYFHAGEQIKFISRIGKFKPKKVISIGTCYEFGLRTGSVSVKDVPTPNTPYAQAKDFVRCASELILEEEAVDFVWARLFYVFGNGQHERSLYNQLLSSIEREDKTFNMSKGEQLFDYMKVEDVADNLCILAARQTSKIVHICNGYPTSVRELVESILREKGSKLKLNLGFYPYRPQDSLEMWGAESFAAQLRDLTEN